LTSAREPNNNGRTKEDRKNIEFHGFQIYNSIKKMANNNNLNKEIEKSTRKKKV